MTSILIFLLILLAVSLLMYGVFGINIIKESSSRYYDRLNTISGNYRGKAFINKHLLEIFRSNKSGSNTASRRKNIEEAMKKVEKKKRRQSLNEKIESSGLKIDVQRFIAMSVALGLITFIMASFYIQSVIVSLCITVMVSFVLPNMFLKSRIKAYQKAFLNNFINALEVIIRGIQSGLPLSDCILMLSKEAEYPINQEFHIIVEEQKIGLNLQQVLRRLYERLPLPEVNFFCIVLSINATTGGNISEPLEGLVDVLRGRHKLLQKVKSATAESKGSAMVLASVPFIVGGSMYFLNPEYFNVMLDTNIGLMILGGTCLWMGLGAFVMKGMINFKY